MTSVKLTDDGRADLASLPTKKLQLVALQWMARLRRAPGLGQPLEWRERQDLRTCSKIYFDEGDTPLELRLSPSKRAPEGPRYRIVYRLLPSDDDPQCAQILGVGPKRDTEGGVYPLVARRLEAAVDDPSVGG